MTINYLESINNLTDNHTMVLVLYKLNSYLTKGNFVAKNARNTEFIVGQHNLPVKTYSQYVAIDGNLIVDNIFLKITVT